MKFRLPVLLLALPLLSAQFAFAAAATDDRLLAARDAARVGDRAKLERIALELQGHELESYVEYWRLLPDLGMADPATIKAFLTRYEGSYIAEKMRGDWLKQLGKKQQWAQFDAEFPSLVQPDQELSCYALQSRRLRGDASMLDDAMPLWLNLIEPPEACYPVLEALILDKRVLTDGVWARIRRQFEATRSAAGRFSMNYLPASQTPDAKVALAVADKPLPLVHVGLIAAVPAGNDGGKGPCYRISS